MLVKDDHAAYILLGIENQQKVHYAMPVTNMIYDALQYDKQVKSVSYAYDHGSRCSAGDQCGDENTV